MHTGQQFAFGDDPKARDYRPHDYIPHCVAYTGTHDNDTTVGWYASLDTHSRGVVQAMLGVGPAPQVPEFLVDAAYASIAALAVVPMQDLLARDSGARMNTPGSVIGNWRWRFEWEDVPEALAQACRERAARTGRAG